MAIELYDGRGNISIAAGKKIKELLRNKCGSLGAFCRTRGFNYNMFTQWLGGFKKSPDQDRYLHAIKQVAGVEDINEWLQ